MASDGRQYVLGIDIGGTFTDVIALNIETGQVISGKAPTTPGRFADGVINSIGTLDIDLGRVAQIVHGTTICTNAMIEGKQARTGFLGTKGFSDEFDIQRMIRRWGKTSWSSIYDLHQRKPAPYVPRYLRRELRERVTYAGRVLEAVHPDAVRAAVAELKREDVRALAVAFLWSTANAEHEKLVKRIIQDEHPDLYVSISSEVAPVVREYERMVTTAVNASLMPLITDYLASVESQLKSHRFKGVLLLMQSHGGIAHPEMLKEKPISTLRGGPVAGVVAANHLGKVLGRRKIVSCDIGGTSCDTSLILDHRATVCDETEVDFYPVKVPTVDIRCIGAGGGSIAYIDPGGVFRVGPESAGAVPGPACYGTGGIQPTITDANLVLGRLSGEQFCAGRVALLPAAAEASMRLIGEPLGWDAVKVADAIVRIAVANMAESVRLQTIERGHDPREFSLVAFGGAGPLHAALLAKATAIPEVIVPIEPGVFSTLGMVVAELGYYNQGAYLKPFDEVLPDELHLEFRKLEAQGSSMVARSALGGETVRTERSAAMRYMLQEWEIRVPIPAGEMDATALLRIKRNFMDAHRDRYGFAREDKPIEFVTLFVDSIAAARPFQYQRRSSGSGDPQGARTEWRQVFVDERSGTVEVPVYRRALLMAEDLLDGPCLIEEPTSTTYIPPEWRAVVDGMGNLILRSGRHTGPAVPDGD